MQHDRHYVVVGAGIAGLATAVAFVARGCRVTVCEREAQWGVHSSGRNAAIWLPIDAASTTPQWARRAAEIQDAWFDGTRPWLSRTGAVVLGTAEQRESVAARLGAGDIRSDTVAGAALARRLPGLCADVGLWVPDAGVIDNHRVLGEMVRRIRAGGGEFRFASEVADADPEGVRMCDGTRVAADGVVIANGAWAAKWPGGPALTPIRRHLFQLDVAPLGDAIVWDADSECYFRPESGGLLASPGDEMPWEPGLPPVDPEAASWLHQGLEQLVPKYADAGVRSSWACLRTFAEGREARVGRDPSHDWLGWCVGLGGRGMTVGTAAGEACATAMLDGTAVSPR